MTARMQQLIRDTNKHIIAAVNDLDQKAQTGQLVHQNLVVANVEMRETIQLFLVVERVLQELMPAINEIGERLQDQLSQQEVIEGHAYEEMETLNDIVHKLRNIATVSNNLEAVWKAQADKS